MAIPMLLLLILLLSEISAVLNNGTDRPWLSAELFCTSVVAEATGIAVASVDTGAPFNTGPPVVTYVF